MPRQERKKVEHKSTDFEIIKAWLSAASKKRGVSKAITFDATGEAQNSYQFKYLINKGISQDDGKWWVLVDPINHEPYIGRCESQPSEAEVRAVFARIAADYNADFLEFEGQKGFIGKENIIYLQKDIDEQKDINGNIFLIDDYWFGPSSNILIVEYGDKIITVGDVTLADWSPIIEPKM